MKVLITGGSGLIGRQIVERLVTRGDQPVILSRRADEIRRARSMKGIEVPCHHLNIGIQDVIHEWWAGWYQITEH